MFLRSFLFLSIVSLFIGYKTLETCKDELIKENQLLRAEIAKLKKETDYNKVEAVLEVSKMNIVYRGIFNPIKIAMPRAIKIEANAKGLRKVDGFGNYELAPGVGKTITIDVKGTMRNGKVINDTKTLRIKNIGTVKTVFQGREGFRNKLKLTKEDLKKGKLTLKIDDFLYDNPMEVKRFKIKLHKNNTIQIEGNKLNNAIRKLVNALKRGDKVQIFDIQMKYEGLRACKITPITIQITD